MANHPIIVIGAGMVGVSTAIWLQRFGHKVLLLDKNKPGSGASFGNAGLLAQWAVAPVQSPSLWRDAPKMMLSRNGPLFVKPRHLPRLAPWMARFMANSTEAKTRSIVQNMAPLVTDAVEQHKALVRGTSVENWIKDSKFSYAYESEWAFKADGFSWDLKRSQGFAPNVLTGAAVQEEEPILGSSIGCLAVLEGQGHITDPGAYITELAALFEAEGGQILQAQVKDFQFDQGQIAKLETDIGSFECSHAVLTAGIWSKELMPKLGLTVPMETERGYHVIFENPSEMPRNPMMITAGKFGVNPMQMGLRCAGTVELADHHAGPSDAPLRLLRRKAQKAFPNLTFTGTKEWLGFRPTLPDSTPMIGEIDASGIYAGFGHQHVGLTAGPKTGRLIAQMISGNAPNLDMSPYAPGRFG